MKTTKRIASALRIIGWVMIAIAVATSIYVLATSGKSWSTMRNNLAANNLNTNVIVREGYKRQYYRALTDAANTRGAMSDNERIASARKYFKTWEDQLIAAEAQQTQDNVDAYYAEFAANLDVEAYKTFYEERENSEETRVLREAIEYLDEISKPQGKAGKIKLVAASCEPDVEAFYATFAAAQGDKAGEYLEFVETLVAMIREDIAGGTSVTDIKGYMNSLDTDRYAVALAALREQEREATEDITDTFVQAMAGKTTLEKADVAAFFDQMYQNLIARYPDETVPNQYIFVQTLGKLLQSSDFDGSMNTLMKTVRTANNEAEVNSWNVRMNAFTQDVIKTSDQSNSVGAVKILWWLAANVLLLWLCGILLILLAKLLDKIVARVTLNRLESAGIEEEDDVLLRVNHLKQYFRSGDYINKAVDDVSFYIKKGEVFGLVGESGCGKTTTGRTIINLYDPTEGDGYFQGLRISSTQNGLPVLIRSMKNEYEETKRQMEAALKEKCLQEPGRKAEFTAEHKEKLRQMRQDMREKISVARTNALESSVEKSKCTEKYREKRKAELTAQYEEDMKSLTGEAAAERKARYEIDMKVAAKDNIMTKMQMIFQDPIASINPRMTVREIIAEGLKIRGIKDEKYIDQKVYEVLDLVGLVREHAARYPHEFSGGQRQRIGIARAIVLEPDLIIADEPISALDVSIQAQVINLLNDLRNKMGLTIMFIAHNLSVVKYFSDRIGVMYYGKLVELTTADELFEHPLHPYTKSLLSAIPYPDPHHEKHRKRIEYNPHKAHDYSVDKPSLREIKPGHFIYCNDKELEEYKKELGI